MIITLSDKRIIFSEQVKKLLSSYRQIGTKTKEAGGILLGQITDTDIYICRASIPTELDKRSLFNFVRSPRTAQVITEYEFYNSDGLITYVGEWHTHPEDHASPSSQDEKMIREQYQGNKIQVDQLVMLIIGRRMDYVGMFDGKKLQPTRCFLQSAY